MQEFHSSSAPGIIGCSYVNVWVKYFVFLFFFFFQLCLYQFSRFDLLLFIIQAWLTYLVSLYVRNTRVDTSSNPQYFSKKIHVFCYIKNPDLINAQLALISRNEKISLSKNLVITRTGIIIHQICISDI